MVEASKRNISLIERLKERFAKQQFSWAQFCHTINAGKDPISEDFFTMADLIELVNLGWVKALPHNIYVVA